ncbi:two-component system, chemotaxis family, response regulator CheB [Desulfuromusa kysingii]|uniref:Protein-glutamate methylesterase/protein-glutamine glutaminase n=1 Tax=Desulfuromusa kysingii TaxID=37625 RepID=A0A1H3VZ85_9BACT|nr:chemotaxis-specific protein-glutamate methyltransferase CheB [Desulfuromusa kysingii]SDZ80127.1 two-component system, chemotaxis family, response regulator CheB [Desulfuromusa kysingii]
MNSQPIIKVLLVDDSLIVTTLINKALAVAPDIEVVGIAHNGIEALNLIPQLAPSVICTDLHMPKMDGLELTREIMARFPRPILVVSISVADDSLNVFKLLEAGALDVINKPLLNTEEDFSTIAAKLINKIRIISAVKVFRRIPKSRPELAALPTSPPLTTAKKPVNLIVIGASTGGPNALKKILAGLPADFPAPIICVQHICDGFIQGLAQWLSTSCSLKVSLAKKGALPQPGSVYFPQEGQHLGFDHLGRFVMFPGLPTDMHAPSISNTMKSAAQRYGRGVLGVLLTGMGADGAEGMLEVARSGGTTIAQDEKSSVVFGMPKQAIEQGAVQQVLPLDEMAKAIIRLTDDKRFKKR